MGKAPAARSNKHVASWRRPVRLAYPCSLQHSSGRMSFRLGGRSPLSNAENWLSQAMGTTQATQGNQSPKVHDKITHFKLLDEHIDVLEDCSADVAQNLGLFVRGGAAVGNADATGKGDGEDCLGLKQASKQASKSRSKRTSTLAEAAGN